MRNLMNYCRKSTLVVCLAVSGCASVQPVQVITERATVPDTYLVITELPHVPNKDTVTVEEGIDLANELRRKACILKSRYRELLRYASLGDLVLAEVSEKECPKGAN